MGLTAALVGTPAFAQAGASTLAPTTLPQNGVVTQGQAAIRGAGTLAAPVLNIDQSSQRATINWSQFNVGKDSTVNFN